MKKILVCTLISTLCFSLKADDSKAITAQTSAVKTDIPTKMNQQQTAQKTAANANLVHNAVGSLKIAYIDPYKIIPKLDQWNDKRIEIQKELEARSKQIEDMKIAYSTKANELQSKGNLLTDAAKDNAIKELKRLETNIQIEQQSFQEYAERVSQEAQMVIFREIELITKEYAPAHGIDFVLAGGAIYVNEKHEISDAIAELMNKKYTTQKTKAQTKAAEIKK